MSRIGKLPITIPSGVNVELAKSTIKVKGPKGELTRKLHPMMEVKKEESKLKVVPKKTTKELDKYFGLTRTLVNNMILGVTNGFEKQLVLSGVGYRAAVKGSELNLTLGYSHPIVFNIPTGIQIKVDKQTEITVNGANKEQVGQVAADIRSFRVPEPYHGKGVRYKDEHIATKVGKSGAKK
ncbi:MAG: 50S ribosomal protein L6 [Deltaproteobacteria bacterium]|nr:50S ribosomal protein L6 [Deltaproteobacteria bacterium]